MDYNPFHKHCGPFNRIDRRRSRSRVDEACRQHDIGYAREGWTAYFGGAEYDEKFVDDQLSSGTVSGFVYSLPFMFGKGVRPGRKRAREGGRSRSQSKRAKRDHFDMVKYQRKKKSRQKNGRRKRVRKRRVKGTKNLMRLVNKQIVKRLFPARTHISESSEGHDIPQGNVLWVAGVPVLHRTQIEAAYKDTGEGGEELGTTFSNEKIWVEKGTGSWIISNTNQFPMRVECWWLLAKFDEQHATSARALVISLFKQGVNDRMLDSDQDLTSVGSNDFSTVLTSILPSMSPLLQRKFKIKRGRQGWVEPGGQASFRYSKNVRKYFYLEEIFDDDSTHTLRRLTVVPLFRFFMFLGNDTTTRTTTLKMAGTVNMEHYGTVRLRQTGANSTLIGIGGTVNTAGAGEGPTEMDTKEDE